MEYIKLSEICDLQNGYAFKSNDYVDYSNTMNCRMSNIRPGAIFDLNYSPKYLPDDFAEKYSDYLLSDEDIVIAMTDLAGDPKILGVPAQVITNGKNVLLNQRVGRLILKNKDIDFRYLKYNLSNPKNKEYYKRFSGGGLQINISKKDILNLEIPLHETKEQFQIANKLDNIQGLIDIRKEEIEKCNSLIKSQFVEMFENSNYIKYKVNDVCESIIRGPFGSALKKEFFVEKGVNTYKVYEQKNAINSDSTLGVYYIDESKFNELKRFECKPGDIIMSCSGTIGKILILPDTIERGVINQALLKFRVDNKKVTSQYFVDYIKLNINKLETKGSGLQNLGSVSFIKDMMIPVPPIDEQIRYEKIVQEIDKQKFEFEKSLKKLEELQASLMQEYFG